MTNEHITPDELAIEHLRARLARAEKRVAELEAALETAREEAFAEEQANMQEAINGI